MTIETSYSHARAELASLMSRVTDDREVVVITRRNHPDVAMIAADELSSLMETAHLLRSPANAERLLAALQRSHQSTNRDTSTVAQLRKHVGYERD